MRRSWLRTARKWVAKFIAAITSDDQDEFDHGVVEGADAGVPGRTLGGHGSKRMAHGIQPRQAGLVERGCAGDRHSHGNQPQGFGGIGNPCGELGILHRPLAVELQLLRRVPEPYRVDSRHWLILHGRYICQARKPLCWQCAVARCCDFQPKTAAPR